MKVAIHTKCMKKVSWYYCEYCGEGWNPYIDKQSFLAEAGGEGSRGGGE